MPSPHKRLASLTRRDFGRQAAALLVGHGVAGPLCAQPAAPRERLPVAAIVTEYRRNSHADVIVGKILEGCNQDGGAGPALRLAALYTDQVPSTDLSRDLARRTISASPAPSRKRSPSAATAWRSRGS